MIKIAELGLRAAGTPKFFNREAIFGPEGQDDGHSRKFSVVCDPQPALAAPTPADSQSNRKSEIVHATSPRAPAGEYVKLFGIQGINNLLGTRELKKSHVKAQRFH